MAQPERRVDLDPRPDARHGEPAGPLRRGRGHGAPPDGARRRRVRALQPARVATRPRVRPRPPPPGDRPAVPRHDPPAARRRRPDLPGPLRPDPAAVDDVRHRRARGRARRDAVQDPPRRGRRHRGRPPVGAVHPADAAGADAAAGRPAGHGRRRRRRRRRVRSPPVRRRVGRRDGDPPVPSPGRHRPPGGRRDGDVGRRPAAGARRRRRRGQDGRPAPRPGHRRQRPDAGRPRRANRNCPAAHRCGATAPGTATSRSCRSRSTRRWPRRRASAARSTTGS